MENELISVLIPVYNTSDSLEACLDSVVRQDYPSIEIICVDDGSSDHSYEILQKYSEKDSRIRVYRHDRNLGLLKARRTGIENAQGKYILFLDSDDTIDRDLCGFAVRAMEKHQVDILQYSAQKINTETGKKEIIYPLEQKLSGEEILRSIYITREADAMLCMKVYRTELCRKAFAEIPDIHCFVGEDILSSFFTAYYASGFIGIDSRPKYNYYFGKGINNSDKSVSLEKFEQYCLMSRFPNIITKFLDKENADKSAWDACSHMTIRLIGDCCSLFANVADQDKDQASEIFWQNWQTVPDFSRLMLSAFASQKDMMDRIYNSRSYKLGNSVILPLRNLKTKLRIQGR